ncbi:uncharacterized protein SETTUDRAFT_162086, partial [Exserohilum turcica Et28A]
MSSTNKVSINDDANLIIKNGSLLMVSCSLRRVVDVNPLQCISSCRFQRRKTKMMARSKEIFGRDQSKIEPLQSLRPDRTFEWILWKNVSWSWVVWL